MIPNWLSNFNVIRPVLNGFILTNPSSLLSNQICCLSNVNMAGKKRIPMSLGRGSLKIDNGSIFGIDRSTDGPADRLTARHSGLYRVYMCSLFMLTSFVEYDKILLLVRN